MELDSRYKYKVCLYFFISATNWRIRARFLLVVLCLTLALFFRGWIKPKIPLGG